MNRRWIGRALIATLISACASSTASSETRLTPFMNNDQPIQVNARSATESRVWTFSSRHQRVVGGTCETNSVPQISVITAPANGTVRMIEGDVKQNECPNLIRGVLVYYTPRVGFVGHDQVVFKWKGDETTNGLDRQRILSINVQ